MSLYAEYIIEREGFNCIEDSESFLTYKKIDDALFIRDIYITPSARTKGKSIELGLKMEDVARKLKCKALLGSVDVNTVGWERNKDIMIKFGFKEVYKIESAIYFNKEL